MTTDTDVTKDAVDFIIKTFAADNHRVKPSHAHALISHCFGYNSKKAMIDGEDYGTCWCCGDHILHRAEHLNSAGECRDHAGESSLDDEELEDRESWIEYHTKNGGF